MINTKIICIILCMIFITSGFTTLSTGYNKTISIEKEDINPICIPRLLDIDIKQFKFIKYFDNTAQYEIKYDIINIGDGFYIGKPNFAMKYNNTYNVINRWESELINLRKGMSLSQTQVINLYCCQNEKDDVERYAGALDILVEIRTNDINRKTDFFKVQYWNDNEDYEPTLSQLFLNIPKKYEKINITPGQEYYYLKFLNRVDPPSKYMQRMGWIKELSTYLYDLSENIKELMMENDADFINASWPHILPIVKWMENLGNWFHRLSYGIHRPHPPDELKNILASIIDEKTNIEYNLKDQSYTHYCKLLPNIKNIIDLLDKYCNWYETTPWTKPITIQGTINDVLENDTIKIKCRDKTQTYNIINDQDIYNFTFNVTSEPTKNEEDYIYPHNCTLEINSEKYAKTITTEPMLSFCYSGGTYEKNITFKNEKNKNMESNRHCYLFKTLLNFLTSLI